MADIPSAKILNDLLSDNGYRKFHPTSEIFLMDLLTEFCSEIDEIDTLAELKDYIRENLPEFKNNEYKDKKQLIKDVLDHCLPPNTDVMLLPWDIIDFMIKKRRDNQLWYITSCVLPITLMDDKVFNMGFEMIMGFLFMNSCLNKRIKVHL